jgi:hypothetical protein
MFASSILHICVFLISFGIIKHLWHAGTGNKNDSSGGKTREASEGVEYDFYFTEYHFFPV